MQNTNAACADLIMEFTKNYMEKVFFFCLKKTGNQTEAEDLTQDIALHILTALNSGTIPNHFSAWVWQIARNRYSVWADRRHRHHASVSAFDIGAYQIEDDLPALLDNLIQSEDLFLLRRELAFIKSEYRDLVVAYYIENTPIAVLANSLSLSVNTVQQRLHRARTILKEGMNMTKEFGTRSYNPEEITFASSGSQPSGLPWSAITRKIPKNILLQASNNPSTIEELSMELGIALPYMEEEVSLLYSATLLEKIGNKYITNFFILDKQCRLDIYNALRSGSIERSRLVWEFMTAFLPQIRSLHIAQPHQSDDAIKWFLVPHILDFCRDQVTGGNQSEQPARANGETWGIIGYEMTSLPENTVMGHTGGGNKANMFWAYQYDDYGMWDQCGSTPDYEDILFLCDCIRGHRNTASFSQSESLHWSRIQGKYAHASVDAGAGEDDAGTVIPDILTITEDALLQLHQMLQSWEGYTALLQNVQNAYDQIETIFKHFSHKILHEHMEYYISMELCAMRMMSIHDLVKENCLTPPAHPEHSTYGMHCILR